MATPRGKRSSSARPQHTRRRPAERDVYEHPLVGRYASPEMAHLWSPRYRVQTWRRIWLALAETQRELGLPISAQQIRALRRAVDEIDFAAAAEYERRTRHDVMAHVHAFGDAAPVARGIIHLGATSMDVVDNADLLLMREALALLVGRLVAVVRVLADFCEQHADLPTLGFTHLQPAQLTTVGKRASLWLQDLVTDLQRLEALRVGLCCRGLRGATGTQASFLQLLGSPARVRQLEVRFARRLGFDDTYPVCGQTYSRKVDAEIVCALASFAATVQKICGDIRLLAMLREIEEPFEPGQVGSSAMPYKRNPMRCERATGLARYLISLVSSPLMTFGTQMLERTLDDSSNKRLVMPDAFLTADALAILLYNILSGLVVYPAVIAAHIQAELPFLATESILMHAAARGQDRQAVHELLRRQAREVREHMQRQAGDNDLLTRLKAEPALAGLPWTKILSPQRYVGLAPQQTRAYLRRHVRPLLARLASRELRPAALRV
jgi:adenylosuccinate lyase